MCCNRWLPHDVVVLVQLQSLQMVLCKQHIQQPSLWVLSQ